MPADPHPSRYRAYANYLEGTARLIRALHPDYAGLAATLVNSAGFRKLRRQPGADRGRIAELLRSSWFTELLLTESTRYPDLLPYTNPWTMVQAYYALYLAARAYFLAYRRYVGHSHQATLRTLSADLLSCKDRFPMPWTCVLEGDPAGRPVYLTNARPRKPVRLRNPLTSPARAAPWAHFGLFLKTTRQRQLKTAVARWKGEHQRQRLRSPEREELVARLRPTSLFDALYRSVQDQTTRTSTPLPLETWASGMPARCTTRWSRLSSSPCWCSR